MATGGGPPDGSKEEDFRHTCSLCMEPYRGRCPKLLPCFHTFCLPCLTALQLSVTEVVPDNQTESGGQSSEKEKEKQSDTGKDTRDTHGAGNDGTSQSTDVRTHGDDDRGVDKPPKDTFECPNCRTPVAIPEGGVACLQTNFYVDHEVNPSHTPPPPVLCDMCEEGDQQTATHACQQCSVRMCRTCRRYHDKLMADHHVTSVSLGQPATQSNAEPLKRMCPVHPNQKLCFHCRRCDVTVCLHCKLTSHEGHETEDLASTALKAKREVTSLAATALQQIQVIESSLRRVEREDRQLTRHAQETMHQVHARYGAILKWASEVRDHLLEDSSAREETARSQLRAETTSTTTTINTLSSLVSRAARATAGGDADVVMLRNELREAVLSEEVMQHHRQRVDREEPLWGWQYHVTDVLQQEDVTAHMGRMVDGDQGDVIPSVTSMRKLAEQVDRWMNEARETTNSITSELAACQQKLTQCSDDVSAIKKNEADLEKKTTSLSDDLTALKKKETDLEKKTTSLSDDLTALTQRETDLEKKTTSLGDDLTALTQRETDLEKKTTSLGDDLTALTKKEKDLEMETTSLRNDVTALRKKETDLDMEATSLSVDLAALKWKEDELEKKTTSLSDHLTALTTKGTDLEMKTTSLSDDITSLTKREVELEDKTTSLSSELKILKNKEADLRRSSLLLSEKVEASGEMVFFTVKKLDREKTEEDYPAVFQTVMTNEGGCFDATTGMFTVRVPGSYVFMATAGSSLKHKDVAAYIFIDNTAYTSLRGSSTSTGSCSVAVKLDAGQQVWMMVNKPPADYWPDETSFSGTLIKSLL